ncbi:hypothetical protein B0O99DRAFT_665658 [Bisporella sp. PMI_857]|nr:hypothetical protein B0O99DRAFT_665658 [Bisporella sp. PMI_857]
MDDATDALIIQLQIQDSQQLFEEYEGKGKLREGDLSDAQLAIYLYQEDLQRHALILSDRQMTQSIAQACIRDGDYLTSALSQEQTAASDRQTACRLGGVADTCPIPLWTITSEEMDEELLAKLSALYIKDPEDSSENEFDEAESSSWAASRPAARALYRRCVACREHVQFYHTARVPCSHEYCRNCLQDLFRAPMTDDSLFPPRCCRQPITTGPIRIFLTEDLVHLYEQKKVEFDTPNRTYCSNPHCSAFNWLDNIENDQATCPDCDTITCTLCKAASHGGDCPADTALQLVLQTADENGWQRCYSCRRLVELDIGCNHITCPCSAQFCYICARPWKTCACAQWNEDRLLRRANQVVARRPVADPLQARAQVAAAVQNLRTRHNCDHERWQYVRGEHRCEECYHTLPSYIFECRQCNIQACNRCRKNRL